MRAKNANQKQKDRFKQNNHNVYQQIQQKFKQDRLNQSVELNSNSIRVSANAKSQASGLSQDKQSRMRDKNNKIRKSQLAASARQSQEDLSVRKKASEREFKRVSIDVLNR